MPKKQDNNSTVGNGLTWGDLKELQQRIKQNAQTNAFHKQGKKLDAIPEEPELTKPAPKPGC